MHDALMTGACNHCDNCPAIPDEATQLAAVKKIVEALANGGEKLPPRPSVAASPAGTRKKRAGR